MRGIYVLPDAQAEGLTEDQQFIETYFIVRRETDRKAARAGAIGEAGAGSRSHVLVN
ncbi:hypothetical protein [Flaviaesturariibacter flavus]|uniref:hypothetical protein n=1 Tax=Flaviaesturariibacter flavus TaxID=2502780 RepID=UPI0014043331|nr:hypothetical protein [Flaviaesturariibacter flavus]